MLFEYAAGISKNANNKKLGFTSNKQGVFRGDHQQNTDI